MAFVAKRARPAGLRLRVAATPFLVLVLAAPILLGIARLLPAEGPGLALRMTAAGACVLLLPGALILRALGMPRSLGPALAGALAWSLGVVFVALTLTFAGEGSLSLTIAAFGILCVGALVPALKAAPLVVDRSDLRAVLGVAAAGLLLGVAVWWASRTIGGDGLFHLARARKLDEVPVLFSVDVVAEFRGGGVHPGYAFPLWHGALALIARLADVDTADVVLRLPALLAPLALVLAYAAGQALFRSSAGGVAVAAAQAGLVAFPRGGVGSFEFLSLPATASRLLLVPALLALVFSFVSEGGRRLTLSIAAAAFALAVVHPTYALFVAVPLGGFLVARLLLRHSQGDAEGRRIGAALAAVLVPSGLFFVWLLPAVSDTASYLPDAAEKARGLARYAGQLDVSGDSFRLAPEAIARGGPAVVAALLVVPLAVLAARRRFAAFVLGGTLAILLVVLVPGVFTRVADVSSLSQARRLALFLPLPFALAGAAYLLGRFRLAGCAAGLGAGVGLQLAYPGEFTYRLGQGGPGWTVWFAAAGGAAALVLGTLLGAWPGQRRERRRPPRGLSGNPRDAGARENRALARTQGASICRHIGATEDTASSRFAAASGTRGVSRQARGLATPWTAAIALAFTAPIAVAGLLDLARDRPDPYALTPGLVRAIRTEVPPREIVFSNLETSYRIAAYAPVTLAAAPPAHVARTKRNRPYDRFGAVKRFFFKTGVTDPERWRILNRWGARWLVVDKTRRVPTYVEYVAPAVYEDGRYALYRLPRAE